jgi:histidyl-tRNA synthetase
MRLRRYIFDTWRSVVESFGYEEYDAPVVEPVDLYAAKSGEELVNEQTYTFADRGDRRVAIRPEMTPSIARMVAARRQEIAYPARLYSISNFMRYERMQKGREREFWQLNVDLFGVSDIEADIEVISIADAILKKFGARENMYTILVGDRRLTDYLMRQYLGLDGQRAGAMIKLFDRRAKIAEDDFNAQAADILGASEAEKLERVKQITEVGSLDNLPDGAPTDDLAQLLLALEKRGVKAKYDPTLMRGFDYYTGIVFEVFDNSPANNRAMFGGGRYDGLVGLFGVEDLPVVGFAPGETTTIEFLKAWDLLPELKPTSDVVLIPLGGADVSMVADKLRTSGMNIAVDYTDRKVDKKIKAAAKSGIEKVIFVGEDELKSGQVKVKNLVDGSEEKHTIQ